MKMYSIYDRVANAYVQPFYAVNHGSALRSFTEAANSNDSNINKAPHDYILYYVGEWDEATGQIEADIPEKLVHGNEVIDPQRVTASTDLAAKYLSEIKSMLSNSPSEQ